MRGRLGQVLYAKSHQNRIEIAWKIACVNGPLHSTERTKQWKLPLSAHNCCSCVQLAFGCVSDCSNTCPSLSYRYSHQMPIWYLSLPVVSAYILEQLLTISWQPRGAYLQVTQVKGHSVVTWCSIWNAVRTLGMAPKLLLAFPFGQGNLSFFLIMGNIHIANCLIGNGLNFMLVYGLCFRVENGGARVIIIWAKGGDRTAFTVVIRWDAIALDPQDTSLLKKVTKKDLKNKNCELGQRPFGSAHEKFNAWIEAVPKPKLMPEPGEKNGRGVSNSDSRS